MIVVGLLSGTSVDAIDAAATEVRLDQMTPGRPSLRKTKRGTPTRQDGAALTLVPLGHAEYPWPPELRERILAVLPPATTTIGEVCALDNEIGQAFAAAALHAIEHLAGGRAELVATLGQTVFHDVRDGRCHGTLQLGQPAWIAEATGLPVVSDLRCADIAAGGHGAPLASTLDALLLAGMAPAAARAALNLGGIANVTVLAPDGAVTAFDTGPANCLLDLAAARITGGVLPCDRDGALARAGTAREDLLAALQEHPYFAAPPPKSCGRELFGGPYLDAALDAVGHPVGGTDLMATLTELTARTVAAALAPYHLTEVIASGGGIRNPVLMAALRRQLPTPSWRSSDTLGLPSEAKEAYLVALLGALTWHGAPGTVAGPDGRSVTGARHTTVLGRISGAGHAGHAGLTPPTRLHLLPPPAGL